MKDTRCIFTRFYLVASDVIDVVALPEIGRRPVGEALEKLCRALPDELEAGAVLGLKLIVAFHSLPSLVHIGPALSRKSGY